jgi:hypothetical protein
MPVTSWIDAPVRTAFVHGESHVPFPEWLDAIEAARDDRGFRPGYAFVLERIDAALRPDPAWVDNFMHYLERRGPELGASRWAVVTADGADLRCDGTGVEVRAFAELPDALAWVVGSG